MTRLSSTGIPADCLINGTATPARTGTSRSTISRTTISTHFYPPLEPTNLLQIARCDILLLSDRFPSLIFGRDLGASALMVEKLTKRSLAGLKARSKPYNE